MSRNAPDLNPERIPYSEYVLRLLYASFYPAVKLAVDLNYPLDTVKDMMTLALWKEAKRKHSTINLISLIFEKSTRTVKASLPDLIKVDFSIRPRRTSCVESRIFYAKSP